MSIMSQRSEKILPACKKPELKPKPKLKPKPNHGQNVQKTESYFPGMSDQRSKHFIDLELESESDTDNVSKEIFGPRPSQRYTLTLNENDSEDEMDNKTQIDHIIDEIIRHEEDYVRNLKTVLKNFFSLDFDGNNSKIFGNLNAIYEHATKLLQSFKSSRGNVDKLVHVFLKAEPEFLDLYPNYARNKPTADALLEQFSEIIKDKEKEIPRFSLVDVLKLPITRPIHYKSFLERIQKDMPKSSTSLTGLNVALDVITKTIQKGNDYLYLGSITFGDIELGVAGSFIMKGDFYITRPNKFNSIVFLFENILVFTKPKHNSGKPIDTVQYVDSIRISDLGFTKLEHEEKKFYLTDHSNFNKVEPQYILEAHDRKDKETWTKQIEIMLWAQLEEKSNQRMVWQFQKQQ